MKLGIDDPMRATIALQGIVGNRLTYGTAGFAVSLNQKYRSSTVH